MEPLDLRMLHDHTPEFKYHMTIILEKSPHLQKEIRGSLIHGGFLAGKSCLFSGGLC